VTRHCFHFSQNVVLFPAVDHASARHRDSIIIDATSHSIISARMSCCVTAMLLYIIAICDTTIDRSHGQQHRSVDTPSVLVFGNISRCIVNVDRICIPITVLNSHGF
jgi:hypothetical protein